MPSERPRSKLDSLLWRALTRYGRFKYRCLLPAYRLLGLGPERRNATGQPSGTLKIARTLSRVLSRTGAQAHKAQLGAILDGAPDRKGVVIFLPSIGWDIVNTQRSHHLAREFARRGYVAIYDSSNAFDDVNGFRQIEAGLYLCRVEQELLREIPDPILWAFTYNYNRRDDYPSSARVIYDWIDDLDVFPFERPFLAGNHARALRESTLVLTVAKRLQEEALKLRRDAVYLPNGVEYPHFAEASILPPDDPIIVRLRGEGKPIAGYYGALADWFDYDLLARVAELRPDWNFLLIGPMYDDSLRARGRAMLSRANIRWIDARPYDVLPGYLQVFDVAMIPFVINDITTATSPLKLYEYFAGGKPVLTTPLPECQTFPQVNIADGAELFAAKLPVALLQGRDEEFKESLRRLGRENSWTARVETVIRLLSVERQRVERR